MLWRGRRESGNVEDRRFSGRGIAMGGGLIGVIALVLNFLLGGGDLSQLTQQLPTQQEQMSPAEQAADDERAGFVKVVLAETEDVWNKIFNEQGKQYVEPILVLFRNGVETGCGNASSVTGPFYCPADQNLYLDLSFFEEMQNRLHASGDFAMAYVIAHEVGHHVQYLLGTSNKMDRLRQQLSEEEFNRYSVKLELQADFFAGVWAHYSSRMHNNLEPGDIEEALCAANAVGDDRLQKQSQGYVVPDAFTHGTSAQRMYWFKKGFESGDINQGDTFNSSEL